jgi:hypothetical protein
LAVIEADPLAEALFKSAYATPDGALIGGYSEILDHVNGGVGKEVKTQREWPKTGPQFARLLPRITGPLRAVGVDVVKGDRAGGTGQRLIKFYVKKGAPEKLAGETKAAGPNPAPKVQFKSQKPPPAQD